MAKGLIIGDIHGKISQFSTFKDFLLWSAKQAETQKVDFVVNLGDTFHNHAVLRSEIVTEFRHHVKLVTNRGIPYIYIVGNHDCYKPDDMKYHALQGLVGIENFVVVDLPRSWNGMSFVPYCPNKADFPANLQPIAFCHQSFAGSTYGNIVADPNHPATVDPSIIQSDLIYSGHIHLRHSFGKVRYPGSPFALSANDVDQIKGIVVFNTETFEETFLESPMPMWRKIEITTEGDPVEALKKRLVNKADHYIIEVVGTKAASAALLGSKQYKKIVEGFSTSVKTAPTDNDKKIQSISATSVDGIVKEYVERVYKGPIDKAKLLSAAMEVMGVGG